MGAEKDAKPAQDVAVFEMREISVFDESDIPPWEIVVGQFGSCSKDRNSAVKAYPKLRSKHPLYGETAFGANPVTGEKGKTYYFVLDESGEPVKEAPKTLDNKPDASKEKKPETAQAGAFSEIKKYLDRPSRYDRMYFDLNGDLDLTNDGVIKPMPNPPWDRLPPWTPKERMAFDFITIPFDYGPGVGVRPFCMLPWLTLWESKGQEDGSMHFVATVARQGRVRFGKRDLNALMLQSRCISGRFDRPTTQLRLTAAEPERKGLPLQCDGFAGHSLQDAWRVDGEIYFATTTPLGDKLTVARYQGDCGTFGLGAGKRNLKKGEYQFSGSLTSKDFSIGLVDRSCGHSSEKQQQEFRVPVGDYYPSYLTISYSHLRISLSNNYHSDGARRDAATHKRDFFIRIRKDKPFVFDLSNQPEVVFTTPAKDKTFKLGDEISVAAVLIDPKLDLMIRRLTDTSRTEKKMIQRGSGAYAKTETYESPVTLDPTVTITDSAGKKVAEGTMPFG
jgi:hypothetical protein